MSFGTVQLSICEELLCAFCCALLCIDNQNMFYIQHVTMSVLHGIFVMTYSAPLISS